MGRVKIQFKIILNGDITKNPVKFNEMKTYILFISSFLIFFLGKGQGFENFITVSGNKLMDGNREFRFISFNIPNLNYVEDNMEFTATNPYALPDQFEMRDAFATIREMGGRIIRIYTIPVRNTNFPDEAPTYVEAPGVFNEYAFRTTDRMLALANEYGIRIIFSLLNNWQWMGGVPNYASFRDKSPEEFWTDAQLIKDFKKTIRFTINRINTITGVPYKEDKAILCWETGNELQCPTSWTSEIVKYIKKLDKNHLVLDGYYAIDNRPVREESILDPMIDIVSSHHYEKDPFDTQRNILKNVEVVDGRKPYFVGEFGFQSTSAMINVLDSVIKNKNICGALTWSLRYHHPKGGFYWHSEPLGMGIYKAYHWPGFHSGKDYDERNLLQQYRDKAFEIQGLKAPGISVPDAPILLPIDNCYSISWQGSMGAAGYHVERAQSANGPWELIGYHIDDATIPYFPLFHDRTAEVGEKYFYRVRAINATGISDVSNVFGPVEIKMQAIIDNMINYGTLYRYQNIKTVTGNARSFKEIIHRIAGENESEMIYQVPGAYKKCSIYAFEKNGEDNGLGLFSSMNGMDWIPLDVEVDNYSSGETNYEYWHPKRYTDNSEIQVRYIKIIFQDRAQIARIEIEYQ